MNQDNHNKIQLIYLLGSSFSGSTLLGIFLSASPKVNCVGELKKMDIIDEPRLFCTCGKDLYSCEYWIEFRKKFKGNFNTSSVERKFLEIYLRLFFGLSVKFSESQKKEEYQTIELLNSLSQKYMPSNEYLLDTSKSLWRLLLLEQMDGVEVKIIRLKRASVENIASFKKRGFSFFRSFLTVVVNNYMIEKYLKRTSTPFLKVDYGEFIDSNESLLSQIGTFLNVDYTNINTMLKNEEIHIPAGNDNTMKQIIDSEIKLKRDESYKMILSSWQKLIIKYFGN
jgi:hypothetical protein